MRPHLQQVKGPPHKAFKRHFGILIFSLDICKSQVPGSCQPFGKAEREEQILPPAMKRRKVIINIYLVFLKNVFYLK